MFSHLRSAAVGPWAVPGPAKAPAACAVVTLLLAGCSADVTRFDGAFGLTETPAATHASSRRPSSRPIMTEAPLSSAGGAYDTASPAAGPDRSIQVAALPDTPRIPAQQTNSPDVPAYAPPPLPPARTVAPVAPSNPPPAPRVAVSGRTIEVQSGDTISGLARKHNVSIADLMSANNLRSPAIKPGQQLVLPGQGRAPVAVRPAAAPAPAPDARRSWTASHTVKSGESLYAIARQHGVKAEELQKANAITDVHRVRPGTVLKVPGAASAPAPADVAQAAPERERTSSPAPAPSRHATRATEAVAPTRAPEAIAGGSEPSRPRIINGPGTQVAAASDPRDSVTDAAPLAPPAEPAGVAPASPKAGGPNKLRWPVRGKIVSGFGRLPDGTHNDGVNIQVPAGTDVLAAEAGVVAYAGNEVKGYGNLVLVRHDNGWVTAYAHNDMLLVQRGDRVRRGQPVGKAGKTGSVDSPQLHFELRQGSKPVDPVPFMERM